MRDFKAAVIRETGGMFQLENVSLDILFGRTLHGIIEGYSIPDIFIPRLIELWQQGRFPFDKLIKTYALADIQKAVEESESGKVLKAVLLP